MLFYSVLATFNPGIYGPLALMAAGMLLSLFGLGFLLWRRRAGAGATELSRVDEPASEETGADPQPREPGRRRPLVASAERNSGTLGSSSHEDIEAEDSAHDTDDDTDDALQSFQDVELDDEGHSAPELADHDELQADETEAFEANEVQHEELSEADDLALTPAPIPEFSPDISPLPAELSAAQSRPIVFRQFMPKQQGEDGLSFFGGHPIGPSDFLWPSARGAEGGAPLQFIMQWDCAQLAEHDATGLLPQNGVLYFFLNCDRGADEDFLKSHAFLHHQGPAQAWETIESPENARPALGGKASLSMSGCTDRIDNAIEYAPRALPRFPFDPIAIDYPVSTASEAQEIESAHQLLWSETLTQEALLTVQKRGTEAQQGPEARTIIPDCLDRPFPAFPHDFGAIRVLSARLMEALADPDPLLAETLMPELSDEERQSQLSNWSDEGKELFLMGTQRTLGHKLEKNISDDIWHWAQSRMPVIGLNFDEIIEETVDLSLGFGSEAVGNIPAEWIDRAMDRHALVRQDVSQSGETQIQAPTPMRMFGPPSTHLEGAAEIAGDHILLLELIDGAGPAHHFSQTASGASVMQYWILPDDLAAARFENVKVLTSAG